MKSFLFSIVLIVTYLILFIPIKLIYNTNVSISPQLNTLEGNRLLVVANHRRALDPYILLTSLPFIVFIKLLPIRFPTANMYLQEWWQKAFLIPFGCFRAYSEADKLSGMKGALKLSDKGQTIFIFPEGKRKWKSDLVDIKPGVGYLIQKRDFIVIPACINYLEGMTKIVWGAPFKLSNTKLVTNIEKLTTNVFKRVIELERK
jgi:1-acyl-sn-glycerol-3-phosphate acyltransferase